MTSGYALIESLEDRKLFSATLTQVAYFANDFLPGGLITDARGNLYGTTYNGGPHDAGQVFRIGAKTHAIWTLATFNIDNGYAPYASMVADRKGNLFGTTMSGGPNMGGTVFELKAGSHQIKTLAAFGIGGSGPTGPLIIDSNGNLFGTTTGGGPTNDGTVFEISGKTHRLTTLATFNYFNGSCPGGMVEDKAGNLFGTTFFGGDIGAGTVFKIAARTHTLSTLVSLTDQTGTNPGDSLMLDSNGNLYGTAANAGPDENSCGTLFKINSRTGAFTLLASFTGTNGASPFASLIADAAGNLYGTTANGGANQNNGTVFKLSAKTGQLKTLVSFNGNNGSTPYAALVADPDGNLYGTAMVNNNDHGEVFKVSGSGFVVAAHK